MAGKTNAVNKGTLPREAFAIVGRPADPATWLLPHHKKNVAGAAGGKTDPEKTVDWRLMAEAVDLLRPRASRRRKIAAAPEQVLAAAVHLASHYRRAGRALPDVLAALV